MRNITVSLCGPAITIPIWYQGENNASIVKIDLAPLISKFGDGTAQALFRRPSDTDPYPIVLRRQNDTAVWTVSAGDTAQAGYGRLQVSWYVGDTLARSQIFTILVQKSLTSGENPPNPAEPWVNEVLQAAVDAEQSAKDAADAAGKIPNPTESDAGKSVVVNDDGTGYELSFRGGGGGSSDLLWRPTVSEDGEISWTQSASDTPPEPVNIMGPQGTTGATPNLQIGTVTTLDAGSDATASITGTAENPLLNLGVPRGADGSGGETKEWNIIFNEELETATGSVAFNNLDLKELEVYVLLHTPYESTANVYLTSSYDNGVYGDPRILSVIKANWIGVLFNKFEVVTNNLWKGYQNISPYFGMSNFANLSASYSNLIANHEINIPKIEAFTLTAVNQFPVGTRIIIRGR